jgi:hypothetical protein
MNYLYEQLREDNKIMEVRDDRITKRIFREQSPTVSNKDLSSPNQDRYKKRTSTSTISRESYAQTHNSNPIVVFNVRKENEDEKYIIARNYIKVLSQSEFYML